MEYITVYNQQMEMLCVLENANRVGYQLKHNDLWTASFELPAADPKNAQCMARNFVRIPDGGRGTGLYRIVGMPSAEETAHGGVKTYQLEHVMATLFDDVLFGYHEVGGTGVNTAAVIAYILSKQTVARWQLGTCDFTDYYQYNFENVSLLNALMSLGESLLTAYTWEFDTSTTPWTVSLRQADSAAGCGIHYGRNLVGIEKTMDASALITRLYPLGYGEGVNQLTIRSVNSNVPYIDADTASTWGVISGVWTDTRIEDPALLKARAQQVLAGYKNPYITYKARAIDLYMMTGQAWDNYMPGKLVRVMDSEHNISFDARIVEISKGDIYGDPGNVEITIANAPRDAADQVNTIADRVSIGELYSQGATNLFAQSFADNADATHPATFKVYMPNGLKRVNQMLLSWRLANFRAYETGAASGGGSTQTSAGGGSVTATTVAAGECTVTTPVTVTSAVAVYSNTINTGYAGGHNHSDSGHKHYENGAGSWTGSASPGLSAVSDHRHSIDLEVPINADVTIPALSVHVPDHDHSVSIPSHTHDVTIPSHSHGIVYGIYEGGQASSVTIKVDGNTVPAAAISSSECDVVAYMAKDQDGKITRGAWHTVEIVPNALTRIEATLYAQCFIQSVGGGDY